MRISNFLFIAAYTVVLSACGDEPSELELVSNSLKDYFVFSVQPEPTVLARAEAIGNRVTVRTDTFYPSCAYAPKDTSTGEILGAYLLQAHGDDNSILGLPR